MLLVLLDIGLSLVLAGASGLSGLGATWLAARVLSDDRHRLRLDRLA